MATDDQAGTYEQARPVRPGWQLWTPDGWAQVRGAAVKGDSILITVSDGRVFRAGYLDAVLCRKPPAT